VLEKADLDAATRSLMAPLVATLQTAEQQLGLVDAELAGLAEKDSAIQLCATVPGVAVVVAATFVSVIDEAKRFPNAHAVSAYLGLVPGENSTGGKRRLGGITKHGNSHARSMLVQAAWAILRARHKDDPLYLWASHVAETRGQKIAVVALARKLAGILWAMWRHQTVYDPAFESRESQAGMETDAQNTQRLAQALAQVAKKIQRRRGSVKPKVPGPRTKACRSQASKGGAL